MNVYRVTILFYLGAILNGEILIRLTTNAAPDFLAEAYRYRYVLNF
jgi:hypothetical protein